MVELDPAVAQQLVDDTSPQATADSPHAVPDLDAALPDGPLLTGPELDAAFAESGYSTSAFLDADDATLVLVAVGQ
ncbi:hypothetical protein [Isoptericola croceus]|uniref:hypothetical protein n=1 Tax=Isoptericola croceus TaxID=3031406 RepID=UPI0023F8B54F|nr:hypothetical protein [Isoptericola croceus]